jgi:hypothetical protein
MSASSNMVRVELDSAVALSTEQDHSSDRSDRSSAAVARTAALPRTQLLCSLRSLLKKLNQTVLVGDRVRVGSIDWAHGKGQVGLLRHHPTSV